jgi:tetratricopeptide (TPR) repeat protein
VRSRLLGLSLLGTALLSGPLAGCVYYNGMYNANRLAKSARKAEREGRTFQATSLWGQVATKAESVLVRHPTSKYAGEAGLLRAVALARLGQCDQALGSLSRITLASNQSDLTEEVLLATGRCQLTLGNFAAGDAAFSQLLDSKNEDRRREARFHHARLLRQAGRYDEALTALAGIHEPRAATERVLALAGAGRLPAALALTDSLIARGDTISRRWDSLVVMLAQHNPGAASSLLDRVRRLPSRTPELQARMLLEDGVRLAKVDPARAGRRFREAMAAGGTGESAGRASLALTQLELSRVRQPSDLASVVDTLKRLAARYAVVADEIDRFQAAVTDVHTATMSVTPHSTQGDLRLFLAAESARDALGAPRLAETTFRRIPEQWPDSPYGPKAILAAQQLNPGWVDSARALLEERYFDSPYLATIRGESTLEYRQLEDSLGAFAASVAVTKPSGSPRKPARALPPARRPQPSSGGSRVPEPQ